MDTDITGKLNYLFGLFINYLDYFQARLKIAKLGKSTRLTF